MYIYRWDLDKTYLLTDIDSVRGLLRSAVEPAEAKRTVPGAAALVRALGAERDWGRPQIVIVSGSPVQMRGVLERKLKLDGVPFDQLILKDNLRNLRRGRLRAVRRQLGYKLPRLLQGRVGVPAHVRETLFGDDSESDAVIYSIYADAIAGRLSDVEVARILQADGTHPEHITETLSALQQIERADAVDRIFIRLDKGRSLESFAPLGPRVIPVRTWFQAALVLAHAREILASHVEEIRVACGLDGGTTLDEIRDLSGRGALPPGVLPLLSEQGFGWASAISVNDVFRPPTLSGTPDYVALVRRFGR